MALNFANNNSLSAISALPASVSGGAMTLLATQTASGSSTISFTSGIDSTYDEYVFKFINMHPATDEVNFTFNGSIDTGSNYNVTKTTTFFGAYHGEDGGDAGIIYRTNADLAQSTAFQPLGYLIGNGNDECTSGTLRIFNPSSTTFVKHFIATTNDYYYANYSLNHYVAGYCNTTSAIDAIQFKFASGNIDAGDICLYGIA